MPEVTDIKQQVKRADRYAIYIDDKYELSLGESELLSSGLRVGVELSREEVKKLRGRAVVDKALDNALRYVAIRSRSEWEIKDYLKRKKVEEDVAAEIVNKLSSSGFINDLEFARTWVSNRRLLKPTSRRKLLLELRQKHVESIIIDQVLNEDETTDLASLEQLVAKKNGRYKDKLKFMQYLSRQGYNYQDIKAVLNKETED